MNGPAVLPEDTPSDHRVDAWDDSTRQGKPLTHTMSGGTECGLHMPAFNG